MNLKELRELIELVSEKGIAEFEMERQGFRLRICRSRATETTGQYAQPAPVTVQASLPVQPELPPATNAQNLAPATPAQSAQASVAPAEEPLSVIKSPIVGTFYRAPSP